MRPVDTSRVEVMPFGSDRELRKRFMVVDEPLPGNLRFGLTLLDLSNDCVFTFVNVDGSLRPQLVQPVYPTTYDEDARYLAAYRRNLIDHGWKRAAAERAGFG